MNGRHVHVRRKLSLEQQQEMIRSISANDIKQAMLSVDSSKAPGPDGYNASFFKKNWDIVGADIIAAVSSFFSNNKLLKAWNSTTISLIPKVNVPTTMRDFRPISCCNVIYKCISKILIQRIKPCLNTLVGCWQLAFVIDRHISDNILLMQELMRGYHKETGVPGCALKVYIQKAYDSVEWPFVENVLVAMGFPHQMVQWIMLCATTPTYFISFNGCVEGYFKGAKGLRQGDPISPYLFILLMEAFSNILEDFMHNNDFMYHPKYQ